LQRIKQSHGGKQPVLADGPLISPTLTPALPEPMMPTHSMTASSEEITFFDKVKKYINSKSSTNEFLKLCNLFAQDLIDQNMLVNRAFGFIGGNPDLMHWFKKFVAYDGKDQVIENKARSVNGRVSLASCRGLGPSYRLLPKMVSYHRLFLLSDPITDEPYVHVTSRVKSNIFHRWQERFKKCSGRDELCHQVLNDAWASHPTWASEDSGFLPHRKNQHEDALHRIEEERHDYDSNIEACAKTVQLLEPIAQQFSIMTLEERKKFKLPPGLGGQSEAIYKRVIMKLYGRDKGRQVIDQLFAQPYNVVPVVLTRLKAKLEDWKASQVCLRLMYLSDC
jgi:paired amphipathic helix protein Sin3a